MATLNSLYTEATLSTERWFAKKVVDQVFNSNPVAMRLKRDARTLSGGESLELSSIFEKNPGGEWFGEWDTYTAAHNEEIGAGRLDWSMYTVPVVLSHLQMLKNAPSRERRFDLAAQKNIVASKTAADDFGSALFSMDHDLSVTTGTGKQIDSLDFAVGNATATGLETNHRTDYANIERAAGNVGNTMWVSTVDDATTTLSLNALQTLYGNVQEGDERPNLIVSGQTNFNRYWNLLTPIQRLGSEELGKAGFTSLLFNGVPWVVDSHVNTTTSEIIYMLNMNHIELVAHSMAFFTFEQAVMPHNQWVHIGRYYFVGNVLCHAPRYQGKMTALTA